jgi:predicted molibdopterin-dependent oxidoreductase YjgC
MVQKRHAGFVVGRNASHEKPVWKVRVKDPQSEYDGQKFVVASSRNGFELAQGLNVNFLVGSLDGEQGQKVLRAVDVCLEETKVKPPSKG